MGTAGVINELESLGRPVALYRLVANRGYRCANSSIQFLLVRSRGKIKIRITNDVDHFVWRGSDQDLGVLGCCRCSSRD